MKMRLMDGMDGRTLARLVPTSDLARSIGLELRARPGAIEVDLDNHVGGCSVKGAGGSGKGVKGG